MLYNAFAGQPITGFDLRESNDEPACDSPRRRICTMIESNNEKWFLICLSFSEASVILKKKLHRKLTDRMLGKESPNHLALFK